MASQIDATKPAQPSATTASVRQNFAYAKAEIEALQSALATETSNRVADVNQEESDRIAAVSAEATARGNADTALGNRATILETSYSASLSANVALTTTNTWYDGPGISLPAGTFHITAHLTFNRAATGAATTFARITTGTTHFASTQTYNASVNPNSQHLALTAIVTLASPATVKLQATTNAGSASHTMQAATTANGSGNNATTINARRIT